MNIGQLVIPNAGQQFNGNDFRDLRRPGVYVFMLKGKPLYVGMAKKILGCIGNYHKQASKAIELCDQALIYPCVSDSAAKELEKLLISRFQPRFSVTAKKLRQRRIQ